MKQINFKDVYLHNIKLRLFCNNYSILQKLYSQLRFPRFKTYNKYIEIEVFLFANKALLKDGRHDGLRVKENRFLIDSWIKNIVVQTDSKTNRILGELILPANLPVEVLLHLLVFEPLRYLLLRQDIFFVHSAVLTKKNNGLLILGGPGAGKSTLAAALCNKGYRFLSDEFAMIKNGAIYSLPLKIKLDKQSVKELKLRETNQPGHQWAAKYDFQARNITEKCSPKIIIFLRRADKKQNSLILQPLTPKKSFDYLTADRINCLNYEKNAFLRKKQMRALSNIAKTTKAFSLSFPLKQINEACKLIDKLF